MISIAQARSMLVVLVGQPIWNIRRSTGSCFMAEFGALASIKQLPRRVFESRDEVRIIPVRLVQQGEFSLLVEHCQWQIELDQRATNDEDKNHAHMQSVMDGFEGRFVRNVHLDQMRLQMEVTGGGTINLGPAFPDSAGSGGDQWNLKLPDGRYLGRAATGNFDLG